MILKTIISGYFNTKLACTRVLRGPRQSSLGCMVKEKAQSYTHSCIRMVYVVKGKRWSMCLTCDTGETNCKRACSKGYFPLELVLATYH